MVVKDYFHSLPNEIWFNVFTFIDKHPKTIAAISMVCNDWRSIVQNRVFQPLPIFSEKNIDVIRDSSVRSFIRNPDSSISFSSGKDFDEVTLRVEAGFLKKISFAKSFERVETIKMVGSSHLGIFTNQGVEVHGFELSNDPDLSIRLETRNPILKNYQFSSSGDGVAFLHSEHRTVYIYREVEDGMEQWEVSIPQENSLRGFALCESSLVTLLQTKKSSVPQKKGYLRKVGSAVAGKFKKKKSAYATPNEFHSRLKINLFSQVNLAQEIALPGGKVQKLLVDKENAVVQHEKGLLLVSLKERKIIDQIPIDWGSKDDLLFKNNLILAIQRKDKVRIETRCKSNLLSSIVLDELKAIDFHLNIAIVILNDKKIQFYNLTNGKLLEEIGIDNFSAEKDEIFKSVEFNLNNEVVIQTDKSFFIISLNY